MHGRQLRDFNIFASTELGNKPVSFAHIERFQPAEPRQFGKFAACQQYMDRDRKIVDRCATARFDSIRRIRITDTV
jgi:hypothetical protein